MPAHFTIELNGLRFFAEHGMFKEEMSVGNEFEVDISIACQAPGKEITSINQTINYAEVFNIFQKEFAIRRQLLESCAMHIADKLKERFPEIEKLHIRIKKLNPPITNFSGTVGITYEKTY